MGVSKVMIELNGELNRQGAAELLRRGAAEAGKTSGNELLLSCRQLEAIRSEGINALKNLLDQGFVLQMDLLNQDCYAALMAAGLGNLALTHTELPVIDVTDRPVLGEGSNGIVYRIDDDRIVKVLKNETSFDALQKERELSRKAFQLGISCPISYGYALVQGKISLVYELARSTSFLNLIKADPSNMDRYMDTYVGLIRQMHAIRGDALKSFPKASTPTELLEKADKLDCLLPPEYRGRLRQILESIDEEDVLTHGDIQPRNARIGNSGAMFIDMETLSAGPSVIDLGALHRTLFSDWEYGGKDRNTFLDLSIEDSLRFWNKFTETYFDGQENSYIKKNLFYAETIGQILAVNKMQRRLITGTEMENAVRKLKELIDSYLRNT